MNKWLVASVAFAILGLTQAWSQEEAHEDVSRATAPITCSAKPRTGCWKPLADRLAEKKEPVTDREFEDQLTAYWTLAKQAHQVRDFSESRRAYAIALELANFVKPHAESGSDSTTARATIKHDSAALALSMRDYTLALRDIDEYLVVQQKRHYGFEPSSASLVRCAALIGLNRMVEADKEIQDLLLRFDFGRRSPFDGPFFGPQEIDPYQATRRFAAHYLRESRYTDALAMLHMLEEKRKATLANMPKEAEPSWYLAGLLNPAEILEDKAAVYSAMGQDSRAEALLLASLRIRKKTQSLELKRVLTRLAELHTRSGHLAQAKNFANRAAAVKFDEREVLVDPLEATLGFAD